MFVNVFQIVDNLLKLTSDVCQLVYVHAKSFQLCIHLCLEFHLSLYCSLFFLFEFCVNFRLLLVTIGLQFFLLFVVRTL